MTAFATVDQLSAYVGFTVDANQGNAVLENASQSVRAWTDRKFDYITGDVYTDTNGKNIILLPQLPVVNVSQVKVLAQDGVSWVVLNATGPQPDWFADIESGRVIILNIGPPIRTHAPQVQVTYDHGYPTVPGPIAEVTLSIAARNLGNPMDIEGQATGAVSVRYHRPMKGVSVLTDVEQTMLNSFRSWGVA